MKTYTFPEFCAMPREEQLALTAAEDRELSDAVARTSGLELACPDYSGWLTGPTPEECEEREILDPEVD